MTKRKQQATGQNSQKKRRKRLRVRDFPSRQQLPGVPPADSEIWPEQYRGERWKPVYGIMFRGKCQLCAYSSELPKSRQILDRWYGQSRVVLCINHPDSPGELREVLPTETCRNFKAKSWKQAKPKRVKAPASPSCDASDPGVRRIPLGGGLFAIVDAKDYEKISKYKWHATRRGPTTYATCIAERGKTMYMHRMIMRPRRGYVVDHKDGNGLNNRRSNLRECTHSQNHANRGPMGGTSRFLGVYRHKSGKWLAGFKYRGKYYYLGLFEDEVEAAKARDRKAHELMHEYAYLNFPEDFG